MVLTGKLKPKEVLYLTALALYVGAALFQSTYLFNLLFSVDDSVYVAMKMIRYAAYFLCLTRFILEYKTSKNRIITAILLLLFSVIVGILGTDKGAIFYVLMILGAYDIDFRNIVKVFISLQGITILFCLICALFFDIGGETIIQNARYRSFLGFGWVNRAAYIWLGVFLEYIYLRRGRIHLGENIFFMVFALWIYYKTKTKFAFGGMLLVVAFSLMRSLWMKLKHTKQYEIKSIYFVINRKSKYRRRKINRLDGIILMGCAIIGIGLCLCYKENINILYSLNKLVTYRLSLGHDAITKYGLSLFGHDTVWTGASTLMWNQSGSSVYEYVDCAYLVLALDYGLLYLFFVLMCYLLGIKSANAFENVEVKYILLFYGMLSVFEPRLLDFTMNPFVLYGISTYKLLKRNENILFEQILRRKRNEMV